MTRPDHHDPNAQDMKPWKRCCFHKFTMSFCHGKDAPVMLSLAAELDEDGFNVYFEGGLRSDENFNAKEYWLGISREDNLDLSRSHTSTIKNPILRGVN
ncbi:hypothetical protein Tco_1363766 [Tanacetum coccineum]